MNSPALTRPARDALLGYHRNARERYNRGMDAHAEALDLPGEIGLDESSLAYVDTLAYRQAREAYAEMVALEDEYFRRLPRPVMAPCPICREPLCRSFDPYGLDGLWWKSDAQPEEPPACPHFCVLLGAVDLGRHQPAPAFTVHPGPGVPFVVPGLLEHPGMVAVVSEIPLVDGARAFPVAYFAPSRPPAAGLTAEWRRTNYVYTDESGEPSWRQADEPGEPGGLATWDCKLAPWLKSGRLRWCDPGSDRSKLSEVDPARCPFLDLPGTCLPQILP